MGQKLLSLYMVVAVLFNIAVSVYTWWLKSILHPHSLNLFSSCKYPIRHVVMYFNDRGYYLCSIINSSKFDPWGGVRGSPPKCRKYSYWVIHNFEGLVLKRKINHQKNVSKKLLWSWKYRNVKDITCTLEFIRQWCSFWTAVEN